MTGLEKIINQIELDTDNTCDRINYDKKTTCDSIINGALSEAEDILSRAEIDAQDKYDDIIKRAEETAEIEQRKIILSAKQSVVNNMICSALESLLNLPANEYFQLLYRLISKYSEDSNGYIALGKKDLARLPADFLDKVNAVSNGNLEIYPQAVNVSGGFVLIYGGVEVNCSFSSIFDDKAEAISDAVCKLLFG